MISHNCFENYKNKKLCNFRRKILFSQMFIIQENFLRIHFGLINQIQPNPLEVFMSTFILGTTSHQHNITQCKFLHALLHIIETQDETLHYTVNI